MDYNTDSDSVNISLETVRK